MERATSTESEFELTIVFVAAVDIKFAVQGEKTVIVSGRKTTKI
jgi:hypothetical protein